MTEQKRRWNDGENTSGGPAGAPTQPHPQANAAPALSIDDATAINDLYLRGAAARFVPAHMMGLVRVRALREAGLIETMPGLRGQVTVKFTARGRQSVVVAAQIVKQSGPAGRSV